jgi:hypothetical protein
MPQGLWKSMNSLHVSLPQPRVRTRTRRSLSTRVSFLHWSSWLASWHLNFGVDNAIDPLDVIEALLFNPMAPDIDDVAIDSISTWCFELKDLCLNTCIMFLSSPHLRMAGLVGIYSPKHKRVVEKEPTFLRHTKPVPWAICVYETRSGAFHNS